MRASSSARSADGAPAPAPSTRTTTAVMLSCPPPAPSRDRPASGGRCSRSSVLRKSRICCSVRYACSPSEQSRDARRPAGSRSPSVLALDGLVDADGARDGVLVGLVRRVVEVLLRDAPAPDELVDERVVFGELVHLPAPQHVHAAVPHVRDEAAVADDEQRRRRRPHAALLRAPAARACRSVCPAVCTACSMSVRISCGRTLVAWSARSDRRRRVPRRRRCGTRARQGARSHLARRVPAHSVRDDEEGELLVDEKVVLQLTSRFLPTSVAAQKESSMGPDSTGIANKYDRLDRRPRAVRYVRPPASWGTRSGDRLTAGHATLWMWLSRFESLSPNCRKTE